MKRKFKKIAVPTIYLSAFLVLGTSVYLIQRIVNNKSFTDTDDKVEYVDKEIVTENIYVPVVTQPSIISKPYYSSLVTINKKFYDYKEENQEDSIIFYENTYIQNSGVSYKSQEIFDVTAILDGNVIEITDNEILGTTIIVKHKNDIISTYQSLSTTNVRVGDAVLRGQTIGLSGSSPLYSEGYNLHFELTYQGKNLNPELYYNKTIDELQA
jgi:stage II sporulation protein Q